MPRSSKKSAKPTSGKAPNPAFEFLTKFMKRRPKAAYADAAAAAKAAGHKIFPIMWGRAQVMLGRVKAKPRGSEKAKAPKSGASMSAKATRRVASTPPNGAIPVAEADVAHWSRFVEELNRGGTAALVFDGSGWAVTVK